jgi:hypothetical protein
MVHLAMVSCNDRYEELIISIKSALIFAAANGTALYFHIFCDNTTCDHIEKAV